MVMKYKDLTGKKFGRLLVLERIENKTYKCGASTVQYLCECECGSKTIVLAYRLRRGTTKSCGCLRRDMGKESLFKHGHGGERIYRIWVHMRERCEKPNVREYEHYGGRGITVCDEWKNNFEPFYEWAITHGYEESLTIDRIDTNGNYEPSNCRWSTKKAQANNRRNNRFLTYNGQCKNVTQWAEEKGINPNTLFTQLERGWSVERALEVTKTNGRLHP